MPTQMMHSPQNPFIKSELSEISVLAQMASTTVDFVRHNLKLACISGIVVFGMYLGYQKQTESRLFSPSSSPFHTYLKPIKVQRTIDRNLAADHETLRDIPPSPTF